MNRVYVYLTNRVQAQSPVCGEGVECVCVFACVPQHSSLLTRPSKSTHSCNSTPTHSCTTFAGTRVFFGHGLPSQHIKSYDSTPKVCMYKSALTSRHSSLLSRPSKSTHSCNSAPTHSCTSTLTNSSSSTHQHIMGWLRLVGSLKF